MKQHQIIRAYKSMKKLADQDLPIKTAYRIHRMMMGMGPAWEFQREEEDKILRKLKPKVMENGRLEFSSPEDAQAFKNKLEEIGGMEAEGVDVEPIAMQIPNGAILSANDIDSLTGFIEFTEE